MVSNKDKNILANFLWLRDSSLLSAVFCRCPEDWLIVCISQHRKNLHQLDFLYDPTFFIIWFRCHLATEGQSGDSEVGRPQDPLATHWFNSDSEERGTSLSWWQTICPPMDNYNRSLKIPNRSKRMFLPLPRQCPHAKFELKSQLFKLLL